MNERRRQTHVELVNTQRQGTAEWWLQRVVKHLLHCGRHRVRFPKKYVKMYSQNIFIFIPLQKKEESSTVTLKLKSFYDYLMAFQAIHP